jgi:peptidoglycan/LPS O-acetylase OafA/YrhL
VPEPLGPSQRYMPGLDGLRALAVLAVIAYHLNLSWAPGGLLGVGVFFTLSGYLITDLLLAQVASGGVRLREFWLRRARRLLPALFVMLVVVTIWVAVAHQSQLAGLRGQVGAAALYLSNWWQISQHVPYFARFGPPSPLGHLWSLAIEEQFYLLWPWLLLLGVRVIPERRRRIAIRPRLAAVVVLVAIASAIEMAILYHPTFDPSRVYDGTDTRAFGLLFGAALAMVWPSRLLTRRVGYGARGILDGAGFAGLAAIGVMVWQTDQYSSFLYPGGMVLLSLATVLVIACVAHPATRVGWLLGLQPLRWLGVRSYGIYLWHAPVIVLTNPSTAFPAPDALRAVLQVGLSIGLAALSWRFVEEPIRHGALGRLWAQARSVRWRPAALPRGARVAALAPLLGLVFAGLALAGIRPPGRTTSAANGLRADASELGAPAPVKRAGRSMHSTSTAAASSRTATGGITSTTSGAPGTTTAAATTDRTSGAATARPGRTSCTSVVHIGDSTSEGLISSDYLPNPRQRIGAQYGRVGVDASHQHLEITGATSIVETLPGGINAYQLSKDLVGHGYHGCWVIALGTNDTADIAVGSDVSLSERIKRMMSVIGNEPVVWLNAKSLVSSGPYAESNMKKWNAALMQTCSGHPNMRVFDWASVAHDSWFQTDGIHYTTPGYAKRARLIADALSDAFPAGGPASRGCLVEVHSR